MVDSMLVVLALMLAVVGATGLVHAEPWPARRIAALPDSAFAAIEIAPDGRKLRHLPHHDETGAIDVPHLQAARGRLHQVRWLDPASAAKARDHLEEHRRELSEAVQVKK